jgi:hypothetical protein
MTPEEIKIKIEALEAWKAMLESSNSIPLNIQQAFTDRFLRLLLGASSKAPSTESQAVNEAGSASYSVAKPMDGFVSYNVGGTPIFIPYYT